jgi:hypothetical protein
MLLRTRSWIESPCRTNLDGLMSRSTISKSFTVPTLIDLGLLAALEVILDNILLFVGLKDCEEWSTSLSDDYSFCC